MYKSVSYRLKRVASFLIGGSAMTAIAQTGSLQNIIKAAEAPSQCDLSSQGNSQTRPSKASASTTIKPFNSSKDAELTQLTADHLIDILSSRIQTTMNYKP